MGGDIDDLIKSMNKYCEKNPPKEKTAQDNKNNNNNNKNQEEWYQAAEKTVVDTYKQVKKWGKTSENDLLTLIEKTQSFLHKMFENRGGNNSKSRFCKNIKSLLTNDKMNFYKIAKMTVLSKKSSWNNGVKEMIKGIYMKIKDQMEGLLKEKIEEEKAKKNNKKIEEKIEEKIKEKIDKQIKTMFNFNNNEDKDVYNELFEISCVLSDTSGDISKCINQLCKKFNNDRLYD